MLEWADPDRRDDAILRVLGRVYRQPDRRCELVPSEVRVLEALSRGLEYRGAAEVLGLTFETVKGQAKSARRVLRAKNTTHACCEAIRRGLIR